MAIISQKSVQVGDLQMSYLAAGLDNAGPLVICLHGFPDSAHTWRHLLPRLADSGYRAIAPFLRGYAPTEIPRDACYQTAASALDVIGLHKILGGESEAVIIGHDWGSMIASLAAVHQPTLWSKVITMAVPPGSAVGVAFLTNLQQIKRSWYMFFFQHALAEMVVAANDLAYIDMLWNDWSPGFDAKEELALLKPSLRDPQNLQAALGFYRATLGAGYNDPNLQSIQDLSMQIPQQPLLYLHGGDDGCMGIELAEFATLAFPPTARSIIVDDAGHFMHLEQPTFVNDIIISFLTEPI